MPLDRSLFGRTLAESLALFLTQKGLSAKQLARRYDLDPATIENVRKAKLSVGTLTKIALTEGRDLWNALGDELFGETQDEYEERRLQQIINEATDAQERLVRLRARREVMDARSADAVSALGRPASEQGRARHG